jgi:hypothetical protein
VRQGAAGSSSSSSSSGSGSGSDVINARGVELKYALADARDVGMGSWNTETSAWLNGSLNG